MSGRKKHGEIFILLNRAYNQPFRVLLISFQVALNQSMRVER